MDRVHRALRPRRPDDPPRDVILHLHYHQTQVATLAAARKASKLEIHVLISSIYGSFSHNASEKEEYGAYHKGTPAV